MLDPVHPPEDDDDDDTFSDSDHSGDIGISEGAPDAGGGGAE